MDIVPLFGSYRTSIVQKCATVAMLATMPQEMLEFLNTQRVGVLAVQMLDGSPHGATVHFAHIETPLTFIFLTSATSMKQEPLSQQKTVPASFVIGVSEETMRTVQFDGEAQRADTPEIRATYFTKFPSKEGKHPSDVFFTFTPRWWRFTDWTTPEGKKIWKSD